MTGFAHLAQPGVLASLPPQARYLTFDVNDTALVPSALQRLAELADGERLVVGIGASTAAALGHPVPGLREFAAPEGSRVVLPATGGGLWVWLRGADRGELLTAGWQVAALLGGAYALRSAADAFVYAGGRDLTGYEDGTENPVGEAAAVAALLAEGTGLAGSSFVAVQQWQHDMAAFTAMPSADQDNAVGRRRADNEELDDAPASAHVKRTAQEDFAPEAFVLRRSMPWNEGNRAGLMFVAFGAGFAAFEAQLRRMSGAEDGVVDALFGFSRPESGAYFWCPPMAGGRLDLRALGL